jgi:flagellar hook-length control protein FliK
LAEVAQRLPDGPVEISLSPEELGKVRMSLLGGEGQMTVQIVAERPETLDLLRRHIDMLASELRQQGFTDLSFSFGQGGLSGEGASSSANAGGDHGEPPVTDTLPETLPEWGRRPAAGSLDLRI